MILADARKEFPAFQSQVFLDSACVSLAPRSIEKLRSFLDMAASCPSGSASLVSLRYASGVGGVRVAGHLFDNHEDIGRLVEVTGELVRRHAKATA
jgi:selenocysteine lyase/cysteine desulfurase